MTEEKNVMEKSFDGSEQLPKMEEKKLLDSGEITIKEISEPLLKARVWILILGIISIISGVVTVLSITGIIVAWLPILLGVFLIQSAGELKKFEENKQAINLVTAMEKLKTYFKVSAISTIVILSIMILFFSFLYTTIISLLNN